MWHFHTQGTFRWDSFTGLLKSLREHYHPDEWKDKELWYARHLLKSGLDLTLFLKRMIVFERRRRWCEWEPGTQRGQRPFRTKQKSKFWAFFRPLRVTKGSGATCSTALETGSSARNQKFIQSCTWTSWTTLLMQHQSHSGHASICFCMREVFLDLLGQECPTSFICVFRREVNKWNCFL